MFGNRVQSNNPVSVIAPASALPWPPMYLVSALTMSPACADLAWNNHGEVIVLSTTYRIPRALQSSPMRTRSATCTRGFAIVSTNTRRVAVVSAASTFATSVASTNDTGCPCASMVSSRLDVLPKTYWLETMWSPALSRAIAIAPIAAIPVAR
jgi:hypothetical protein